MSSVAQEKVVDASVEQILQELQAMESFQLGEFDVSVVPPCDSPADSPAETSSDPKKNLNFTSGQINDAFCLFRQTRDRHAPLLPAFREKVYPETVAKIEEELRSTFEVFYLLALAKPVACLFFYTHDWFYGIRAELNLDTVDGISKGNPVLSLQGDFESPKITKGKLFAVGYIPAETPAAAAEAPAEETPDSKPEGRKIQLCLRCSGCQGPIIEKNVAEMFVSSKCVVCKALFCCRCQPGILSTNSEIWYCPAHTPTPAPSVQEVSMETVD